MPWGVEVVRCELRLRDSDEPYPYTARPFVDTASGEITPLTPPLVGSCDPLLVSGLAPSAAATLTCTSPGQRRGVVTMHVSAPASAVRRGVAGPVCALLATVSRLRAPHDDVFSLSAIETPHHYLLSLRRQLMEPADHPPRLTRPSAIGPCTPCPPSPPPSQPFVRKCARHGNAITLIAHTALIPGVFVGA